MEKLLHPQQHRSSSLFSLKRACFLFLACCFLAPLFSHAQIPQPTPTNPYPWTQQPTYSPQYYDWQPLRYFGPKYAGYLNTEEPMVYVVDRVKFKTTDTLAAKLGFPLDKDFFTGTENGKANVLGSVKRNDAQTVDLQLVTYRDEQKVWESQVLHYSEALATATSNDQDLLPFAFLDIPVDKEHDSFVIKDVSTNQVLFGPMTFWILGDVGKFSDKFLDEGTPFNPYEEWWYYQRPDNRPAEYFPTQLDCKHSIDTLFPGTTNLVCKNTLMRSVQVKLDMAHTIFKGAQRKFVFLVDTRGLSITLALDVSPAAHIPVTSTILGLPNPVMTSAGEYKKVEIPLNSISDDKEYYVKIYDQATNQQFFRGLVDPRRSQLTKMFSNNSILTKTSEELLGLANISSELDTPAPVPPLPDITIVGEDGTFKNPLAGSNVSNIVEFVQLLFRKLPYMARPALLISIALFALNILIHAHKTKGEEVKGNIKYILLGAGILLATYALGTIISAVVRCFTGTSC